MFRVSVEETFSSGHALRGYKGKCENVHGHNYRVQVSIEGPQLDGIGLLVDFTHVKHALRGIIAEIDHQFLNDLEPFKTVNPSRSEEHTSELQSHSDLVCRLLLEKKKKYYAVPEQLAIGHVSGM